MPNFLDAIKKVSAAICAKALDIPKCCHIEIIHWGGHILMQMPNFECIILCKSYSHGRP